MIEKTLKSERLEVFVCDSRKNMGAAAAKAATAAIGAVLAKKEYANVIFAAAPSQNEMLEVLLMQGVDFSRINALHMDEYLGLDLSTPQSFARYLYDHIFSRVDFRSVHYIPANKKAEEACSAYEQVLRDFPPDIVLMGIGENGHIAFNDPPVADFDDPYMIKLVELDTVCRMQQVHDGCFPTIDEVPTHALTLTVPTLLSAKYLICTVPGSTKAKAVKDMLYGPYGESCPATVLRKHENARLFLDQDSAKEIL